MKAQLDISVIITVHAEGRLAYRTFLSVFDAVRTAEKAGINCEILIVKDNANSDTEAFLDDVKLEGVTYLITEFGDPGLARNFGVLKASGTYIAFLDGDDLFSASWLQLAYECLSSDQYGLQSVAVPEFTVVFDSENLVLQHPSSNNPGVCPELLIDLNLWNSVILVCSRELLNTVKFEATPNASGFGYEDWHWFSKVLALKIPVKAVSQTSAFCRRKCADSRLLYHDNENVLLGRSDYFHPSGVGKPDTSLRIRKSFLSRVWSRSIQMLKLTFRMSIVFSKKVFLLFPGSGPVWNHLRTKYRRLIGKESSKLLPEWLVKSWSDINAIEPELLPDFNTLISVQLRDLVPVARVFSAAYAELCRDVLTQCDQIFIVPWLKKGGSDLETLNYISAVLEHDPKKNLIVFATESTDSPWRKRLPPNVTFLTMGNQCNMLDPEAKERLLATFLIQLDPSVVHIVNSDLGYRTLARFGNAITKSASIFASIFCEDYTEEGLVSGYPVVQVPKVEKHLSGIFADNARILMKLRTNFALDKKRLFLHYQPTHPPSIQARTSEPMASVPIRVLWAGRLDRQKRPDILIEIAEGCENMPVSFHVFGEAVLDRSFDAGSFKVSKNIEYHGSFDGIDKIPLENFDLFLNTSQWEGLPNILMEVMLGGLPVITSDAGGIPELISHRETGLLISPADDVSAFISEIEWAIDNPEIIRRINRKGYELVKTRHSWEKFTQNLASVPGYFTV